MTLLLDRVNSTLYWQVTPVAAAIDGLLALVPIGCLSPERFRQLRWPVVATSALFWAGLWAVVMSSDFIWQMSYRYVFAAWLRWAMPLLAALYYGAAAWLIWWLALHLPGRPVLTFLLLGGLISLPGHLWAITVGGILDTPLLRHVGPAPALIFGFFEFIFYWSLILGMAALPLVARRFRIEIDLGKGLS
jgi:hypothetical protein